MKNTFAIAMSILISMVAMQAAEAKIGGGDIRFSVATAGDVVYSHDAHVSKLGMTCTECHYGIFARSAHNDRDKATMAAMQDGKSCGACHNGSKAFDVKSNCARCHQQTTAASKSAVFAFFRFN